MRKFPTSLLGSRNVFAALCLILALGILVPSAGQQRTAAENKKKQRELERKRKEKEAEIRLTKKLLSSTQNKKNKSLNQLRLLNKQIKIREELIKAVNNEVAAIGEVIQEKNQTLDKLNADLQLRKEEYAAMIYAAYKNQKLTHPLRYVLSSNSFNQATKRLRYIKDLSKSRTKQLDLIKETRANIQEEVTGLKEARNEKQALLGKEQVEKSNLEKDKSEEGELVSTLRKKEKELRRELEAKRRAARKLDEEIKRIIAEELRRAKAEEEARRKKGDMALTPEAAALSAKFSSNKGKLPWPVQKGFILKSFGTHRHPTLPNVQTVNNGVDIVTTKGASARAVFGGEVRAIFSVPGMQDAVMINHGEFFTVYTHLQDVKVKKGDKVTVKQVLGTVYHNTEENKSIIHFELWYGNKKQDPETWIYKKN